MEKIGISAIGIGLLAAFAFLLMRKKEWKPEDEPEYSHVKEKDIVETYEEPEPEDKCKYVRVESYGWVFSDTRQKWMSPQGWRYADSNELVEEMPKYKKYVKYVPRYVSKW